MSRLKNRSTGFLGRDSASSDPEPGSAAVSRLPASVGKKLLDLRAEAVAGQGPAPGQGVAGRWLPGPEGEHHGLRQFGEREDSSPLHLRS